MSYHAGFHKQRPVAVASVLELRQLLLKYHQTKIGFVPTMGALHEGHLSLIARAKAECDLTVVSIFVNPTQFDRQDDLVHYPRNETQDLELLRGAGADIVFLPSEEEMYPTGDGTKIFAGRIAELFEGEHRGLEHFAGVATVVTKLLSIINPTVAYFGEKDAQQVAVVKRVVTDLLLPVQICTCPTVREENGLALSSRNTRLSAQEHLQAQALALSLQEGQQAFWDEGVTEASLLEQRGRQTMRSFGVEPEYFAAVDPVSFQPVITALPESLLIVAAHVGTVRLIDNVTLNNRTAFARSQQPGLVDTHLYPLAQ